jgi:hypothetical protein
LSDLELYRKDDGDGCPRCAKFTAATGKAAQEKVWEMISRLVEGAVRDVFGTHRTEALRASRASAPGPGSHDSRR